VGSRLPAVLACFDVDNRELTLTEIAQRSDVWSHHQTHEFPECLSC
jgi:hypothetical protein